MNEEENRSEEDSPVALVEDCVITKVLGDLKTTGAKVTGTHKGNSTRWVFDIEAPMGSKVLIELLSFFGENRPISPLEMMTGYLAPTSAEFYEARPVLEFHEEKGSLTLATRGDPNKRFSCRVLVDTMGSQSR